MKLHIGVSLICEISRNFFNDKNEFMKSNLTIIQNKLR